MEIKAAPLISILTESEGRYVSLFENNHAVMPLIDPINTDIVDANPTAISYYIWSHEELTQKKITDLNTLTEGRVHKERIIPPTRRSLYPLSRMIIRGL